MKKELTIIQMNDTHGYLEEHYEHFYKGDELEFIRAGGYARIGGYLNKVRHENENVLFLDGGDTFHGTFPVVTTRGQILPDLLNKLKLDGMTAHWEFAYGPKDFLGLLDKINCPMLAINCYDKESDELVFKPYIVKEFDGLRVGIIGIAATIIDKTMPEHFSEGLYFTLGNKELPTYIDELKNQKGVDLIVVLSHLGYPQEVKLAKEVSGIDVLLSAHTHNRIYEPSKVNGAIIIQSGCHGSFLGHLDLSLEDGKIKTYKHKLVVLDKSIPEDPDMKEAVKEKMKPYKKRLSQIVGRTNTDLTRSEVLESTMDNFLLQSLLDYTGAQVAFSNGWRYGAPIPKGEISENDLWNIIPVNPPVSKVMISGKEIWEMMEENLEKTFARDPYDQMGGYVKRCLGINLYFKIENAYGHRIQNLFVNGEEVNLERDYMAVFVTSQGVPKKYGHTREKLDIRAIDVLKEYLKKYETIEAPLRRTIVAI